MSNLSPRIDKLESKQLIINGNMDFFQRSTSTASCPSGTYVADRFKYNKSGTMVHTYAQGSSVPTCTESGFNSSNSLELQCTTAQASIGSGDYSAIYYYVEGSDWAPYHGGTSMMLSFWVYSYKIGTYGVAFRNGSVNRSYVTSFTVNTANIWQLVTIKFNTDSVGTGWAFNNGIGLYISIALAFGSTYQTGTLGSWQGGNFLAPTTQVNACDSSTNAYFRIAQVMLRPVDSHVTTMDTTFVRAGRTIQEELALCQRYYEKSYNLDVVPGTIDYAGAVHITIFTTSLQRATVMGGDFKATKRTTPTVKWYATQTLNMSNGTYGTINVYNGTTNIDIAGNSGNERGVYRGYYLSLSTAGAQFELYAGHWTANAEF